VAEKPEAPKPNFNQSGLLAKETNTVKGVQLKYNEPPEARKPLKNWRLYVFKGKEQIGELRAVPVLSSESVDSSDLDLIHIYRQSAYLVGRDEIVSPGP
jgi:smad nuclear-interacting protein 1